MGWAYAKSEAVKIKSWLKAVCSIATGGAAGGVLGVISEHSKIANMTAQDWQMLNKTTVGGALIAVVHYLWPSPIQPSNK